MSILDNIKKATNRVLGKNTLEKEFDKTLSVKIQLKDRVRSRSTGELGTVIQTGVVDGSAKVPAISVRFDSGLEAWLVPAEQFTKATKY